MADLVRTYISRDEWWPVFTLDDYRDFTDPENPDPDWYTDIPQELFDRAQRAAKEFNDVQCELAKALGDSAFVRVSCG